MYDSQAGVSSQMSGIIMGGGSKCDCYNNNISEGKGDGIEDHGLGGNKVFNNLIIDAGQTYFPGDQSKKKHGIYIDDITVQNGSGFHVLFNDIINPKCDGIRFQSTQSSNNLIVSNVIINPGDYALEGASSYIEIVDPTSDVNVSNNYLRLDTIGAGFASGGYDVNSGSPLIDAGYFESEGINFDFLNNTRPQGSGYDIGAYEFTSGTTGVQNISLGNSSRAFPNPAHLQMNIAYEFSKEADVLLDIYNLQGARIYSSVQQNIPAGGHTVTVDVGFFQAGLYMYTLRAGNELLTGKFVKRF
jgi:hypothetical protein